MLSSRTLASVVVAAAATTALVSTAGTSAVAAPPAPEVTLTPIGTYATGAFDEGASEIVAHDPTRQRLFVVNAQAGTVDVLDIRDPRNPVKLTALATPGANSVAVSGGLVAVAQQADTKTDPGSVTFFDAATYAVRGRVTVGSLPDMVTFTGNGEWALVANEGEPEGYCAGQVDPEGSVSVIDLRQGAEKASAKTAGFTAYNDEVDALRAQGVRIFGPGATVAQDLEPEYITTSTNGKTAWVTLQEANAIATVDVRTATVTDIAPLGLKDHSLAGQGLDASDKDKKIAIAQWPVKGMYQPDAIAAYAVKGQSYLVTANEGDARDYDCFSEEERIKDVTLDPAAFPNAAALQQDSAIGRLNMSTATSPKGPNGYTELQVFGGRSVSVRAADGTLLWDSGDALEQLTATVDPELFNADHTENGFDKRSDNKGPEPEGLDLGKLGGRTYAFVGLERNSGIVAVDVTDPANGRIAGYGSNRDKSGDPEAGTAGDLGPEGILFIAGEDSPTGTPLLAVGNEVSGTTTLWEIATK
ncbi:hypothetical protein BCF74_11562 [Knoellia remsis]|uniref:Choice-of-anchor I domain-containing protein n=1 Tax=Knoellia remsis TaxID=407159 RepID=A0A2T0UI49_9MICO|nr:choice-of-anchor I family protein [Knoellia remsis]PRY57548.1 hypothetical protein BCF74_11562 [Knoellia remsis]